MRQERGNLVKRGEDEWMKDERRQEEGPGWMTEAILIASVVNETDARRKGSVRGDYNVHGSKYANRLCDARHKRAPQTLGCEDLTFNTPKCQAHFYREIFLRRALTRALLSLISILVCARNREETIESLSRANIIEVRKTGFKIYEKLRLP